MMQQTARLIRFWWIRLNTISLSMSAITRIQLVKISLTTQNQFVRTVTLTSIEKRFLILSALFFIPSETALSWLSCLQTQYQFAELIIRSMSNNSSGNVLNKQLDFNRISDMPSIYPRVQLPQNLQGNMQLGGGYQDFIFGLGNCCGNLRTCCPCLCCVEYPYKQIDQSFIGIYQRFGRYVKTMGSGLQYFNPFTDKIHIIDMKTNIININRLKALTRDNIEVQIDAAVYYHVRIPRKTFYSVANIQRSVQELTFATLRAICGHYVLQDLLEKRDEVTLQLGKFVARQVHEWGIEITNILIKDIILNQQLQDILAAVAKQKRLAESKILNATAEVQSAKLMRQTADILSGKAAMQIRYLQAIQNMAGSGSVKVVFLAEES